MTGDAPIPPEGRVHAVPEGVEAGEVGVPQRLPEAGVVGEAVEAGLILKVINRSSNALEGHITVALPELLGGGVQRIPFKLPGPGEKAERLTLNLPEGEPEAVELSLGLEAGSKRRSSSRRRATSIPEARFSGSRSRVPRPNGR